MNVTVKIDDTNWQNFLTRAARILRSSDGLLKRAILAVWPKEIASHFDQEQGYDGKWAPWKDSTRSQRIVHEIRSALGGQHSGGRLSAKAMAKGARKADNRRAQLYARGHVVQRGGKLLQKSVRLRDETVQEPILTQMLGAVKIQSPTPYSGFLDEGTKHMEARPFMWLGDEAQDNLSHVFMDLIGDEVGGLD